MRLAEASRTSAVAALARNGDGMVFAAYNEIDLPPRRALLARAGDLKQH